MSYQPVTVMLVTLVDSSQAPGCFAPHPHLKKRWLASVTPLSGGAAFAGDIEVVRAFLSGEQTHHRREGAAEAFDRLAARLCAVTPALVNTSADTPMAAIVDVVDQALEALTDG